MQVRDKQRERKQAGQKAQGGSGRHLKGLAALRVKLYTPEVPPGYSFYVLSLLSQRENMIIQNLKPSWKPRQEEQ